MNKKLISGIILLGLLCGLQAQIADTFKLSPNWKPLLDKELSNFELFVGVPHTSVVLEGFPKSDDVTEGTPLGLNNDPKNIMTTSIEDEEVILNISGEIYAGLTTLQEFGNYHLKAQFKWGEKKWEPRLDKKRDNGILYHCHGEHGAFWNVWMSGLECQVQETDMGDFVALVNGRADIECSVTEKGLCQTGTNNDSITIFGGPGHPGYCHINEHNEKPNGEWNTLELICVGDKSIHVVNGKVLMVALNTRRIVGDSEEPLTIGKLQFQSEGAEAYYKSIQIKSVNEFPKKYKKQAELFLNNKVL